MIAEQGREPDERDQLDGRRETDRQASATDRHGEWAGRSGTSTHAAPVAGRGECSAGRVELADYQHTSELLRALTAPARLAIIDLLGNSPRCVHDLVGELGIAQPLVSQHLKVLRAARLVSTSRRGREIVYTLADHHVGQIVRDAMGHAAEPAAHDPPRAVT